MKAYAVLVSAGHDGVGSVGKKRDPRTARGLNAGPDDDAPLRLHVLELPVHGRPRLGVRNTQAGQAGTAALAVCVRQASAAGR